MTSIPPHGPQRDTYAAPRLIDHGTIDTITLGGTGVRVEKHPLDMKKGSKIRPR